VPLLLLKERDSDVYESLLIRLVEQLRMTVQGPSWFATLKKPLKINFDCNQTFEFTLKMGNFPISAWIMEGRA